MATLTVGCLPTPTGAEAPLDTLTDLQKQQLITLQDWAVVTWPQGAEKPRTHHLAGLTGVGAHEAH
ncbi:putative membrane protein [Streptacidiphilus sp. MAP12-16]